MSRWCCCYLASSRTSSAPVTRTAHTSSCRNLETDSTKKRPRRAVDIGALPIVRRGATRRERIIGGKEFSMLMTLFVILLVMWLLGMISSYTLGGFIHILLLVALVVVLIRIIEGRRPL